MSSVIKCTRSFIHEIMGDASQGKNEPLQLEPFIHQVGGHSSMLQLNKKTICKPLILKELKFYQNCPACLKCFIPEYKGMIEVVFSTDVEGYLDLTTYLPLEYEQSTSNSILPEKSGKIKHRVSMLRRIRVCQSGDIQIESDSVDGTMHTIEKQNLVKEQQTSNSMLNPWVLHCHQKQLMKIKNQGSSYTEKYILLEDLTSKYEFPCILDIKMGTQPYGDEQSLAKQQGHLAKNASTTSSSLGIRICGIQVYHHDAGHYVCHNKYYGRGLTVEGFHQALYHFFHDGIELRQDVISQVLHKLQNLYDIILSLDTFRFFTSSLLIIYNGKKNIKDCSEPCYKTKYRDNSNSTNRSNKNSPFFKEERTSECAATNNVLSGENEKINIEKESDIVDVRMIDFAHSSVKEPGSLHSGPDEGYLFGLKNLIQQLKTFQPKLL